MSTEKMNEQEQGIQVEENLETADTQNELNPEEVDTIKDSESEPTAVISEEETQVEGLENPNSEKTDEPKEMEEKPLPIKKGHIERELTHLLREAGRFLHPGPKDKVGQKEILMVLNKEKELTQKRLAEKLHKSPAAISDIIRKLDHADLIERVPNPHDRRMFDIELTEHGKQIAHKFEMEHPEKEEDMYSILSPKEQEDLLHLLDKLITNWRETKEMPKPPVPPRGPHAPHKPGEKPIPPKPDHGPGPHPLKPEPLKENPMDSSQEEPEWPEEEANSDLTDTTIIEEVTNEDLSSELPSEVEDVLEGNDSFDIGIIEEEETTE